MRVRCHERWDSRIDGVGAFSDIGTRSPCGDVMLRKLLSVDPGVYVDSAVDDIRTILSSSRFVTTSERPGCLQHSFPFHRCEGGRQTP